MTRTPLIVRCSSVIAAVAIVMSACGSSASDDAFEPGPTSATASAPTPDEGTNGAPVAVEANGDVVDVVALDNSFRLEAIEIVAGTAIRWENRGRNDHDVLPADETLEWGVDVDGFAPGDEYTLLFDTPGEFAYFCSIHGTKDVGMIGTVVVLPANG